MTKTKNTEVIVCDPGAYTRSLLLEHLARIPGCSLHSYTSLEELDPFRPGADDSLFVLNHSAHQAEPFGFIERIKQRSPDAFVVVITSPGAPLKSIETFQAAQSAIDRIYVKPIDLDEFAGFVASRIEERCRQRALKNDHLNLLRFLPTGALRRIFDSPAPGSAELFQMTVMFTDIRDSSRLIIQEGARVYFAKLNAMLASQARQIRAYDGMVVKTTGDGLLAVFEGAARCHLALKCAAAIQKTSADNGTALGIGLSDGLVLTGILGSDEHLHFDVIGSHVHLAARLCGKALAGEILATTEVADKGRLGYRPQDSQETIQVRGFDAPVSCIHIQSSSKEPV